jgi:hypothetical protein
VTSMSRLGKRQSQMSKATSSRKEHFSSHSQLDVNYFNSSLINPTGSIYVPESTHVAKVDKPILAGQRSKGNLLLDSTAPLKDTRIGSGKITMVKQRATGALVPNQGMSQHHSPSGLKTVGKIPSLKKAPASSRSSILPSNSSITRNKLSGLKPISSNKDVSFKRNIKGSFDIKQESVKNSIQARLASNLHLSPPNDRHHKSEQEST